MKRLAYFLVVLVPILTLLAACSTKAGTSTDATPTPAVQVVTAEGHLVPGQSAYIPFFASGTVTEILVTRGEAVKAGAVLARIGDHQQAHAGLAAAQLAQTAAQQDYDKLVRTAGLVHSQAWLDLLEAQKNRSLAQLAWDRVDPGSIQSDILNAQADVTTRQTELEDAQKNFDKYSDLPVDNATRKSYENALRTAQTNYDLAVQKLENLTTKRDNPRATLDLALAAENEAQLAFDHSANGPDVDALALAQARLDNAKAQVAAAQFALDAYDLKAPFDGTVEEINITLFQVVSPTTWAVAMADTSQWYVDSSDLGEMDVVKLTLGQTVTVTVDALPGETFTGVVESISGAPIIQTGDILYKVHVRLNDPDKRMLWGMTAELTFEEQK